jgi:hypothetical protein
MTLRPSPVAPTPPPMKAGLSHLAFNSFSECKGFASSPLRGEDNDGFAQQCRREVGVNFGQLDSRTNVTPTSRGKFDFCEGQKSSRAVLPPQGGGGEKPKDPTDGFDGFGARGARP